jgi:hypothetical protein
MYDPGFIGVSALEIAGIALNLGLIAFIGHVLWQKVQDIENRLVLNKVIRPELVEAKKVEEK